VGPSAQFTFLGGGGLLTVHHLGELEGGMNVATPRNKSFPECTATSDPANDYTGCIHIMFRNVRKCEQLHSHQIFLCIILKESTNTPRQQNNTSGMDVPTHKRPCDIPWQTMNQMTSYSNVERR